MMNDSISRQTAIDALERRKDKTANGEIGSFYNTIIQHDIDVIAELPSAQPEIIRCKDCKYWHREILNGIEYFNFSSCDLNHYGDGHNFYCADAERRTDE